MGVVLDATRGHAGWYRSYVRLQVHALEPWKKACYLASIRRTSAGLSLKLKKIQPLHLHLRRAI
jgi:hypothetical protein